MKKLLYGAGFGFLAFVFVMAYYGCYYYAKNNINNDVRTIDRTINENPAVLDNTREAANTDSALVSKDTKYILETYDSETGKITNTEPALPADYIGMNREGLVEYLKNYLSSNSENNLKNIQLISFSTSGIVIRKTIEKPSGYWILMDENEVKVYEGDKETLYLETGIGAQELETYDRNKVLEGVHVKDLDSLYKYLETITS